MSYLFRHSSVGTAIHYIRKGNFDFSRTKAKTISASSSTDDVPAAVAADSVIGVELKLEQSATLVGWQGPDDPSNPQVCSLKLASRTN
jgi:DHA1 family multidrug resistance protein-like MFS transporter